LFVVLCLSFRRLTPLFCLSSSLRTTLPSSSFFLFTDAGRLVLEGADNPGIVHKVAAVLARHGLNVDRMDTSEESAPYGGTTLFQMSAIVQAYEPLAHGFHVDLAKCKEELEDLGDSMNCDIHLDDTDEKFQTAFFGS
jgi:predicted amino acid-binding ACT domain protein